MATSINDCGCGCNPCVCTSPSQIGSGACLPTICLPRPTFFDGQVIGAEDLNAAVSYAKNQEAILARLLGGWGILGGLKLDAAPGLSRNILATDNLAQLSPNPQVIAGTRVQVSAGVAIDAAGNKLVLCAPVELDIAEMAMQSPQGRVATESCAGLLGPACPSAETSLTVTEYFLVAELAETQVRPVGRIGGPGACDTVAGCEPSRIVEKVKFSLVTQLPEAYQFTGCLGNVEFKVPTVVLGGQSSPDLCREEVFALIDNVQSQLAGTCCERPVVVLGRVMLTSDPGKVGAGLPYVSQYLLVADAYPCRKPTFQVGWFTKIWPNVFCNQVISEPAVAPFTVVQTAGDHVVESVTAGSVSSAYDWMPINRQGQMPLQARLLRPRLATSSLKVTFSASFMLTGVSSAKFQIYLDGYPVVANGVPLLGAEIGSVFSTVQISDTIPASVLGEARAHSVTALVALVPQTEANTVSIKFDPTAYSGAAIVIQEISG